jgi:hypothetical protein
MNINLDYLYLLYTTYFKNPSFYKTFQKVYKLLTNLNLIYNLTETSRFKNVNYPYFIIRKDQGDGRSSKLMILANL